MSQTPDPHHARRRTGGWLLAVGVMALFVSTFTVPEAIHHLARVSAEDGTGLSGRAVVVVVVGAVTLLGGGALAIAGLIAAASQPPASSAPWRSRRAVTTPTPRPTVARS